MILSKQLIPSEYTSLGLVYENTVVATTLRSDFKNWVRAIKNEEMKEYEELFVQSYDELLEKMQKKLLLMNADALFSMQFHQMNLYPGATLLVIEGEAAKK